MRPAQDSVGQHGRAADVAHVQDRRAAGRRGDLHGLRNAEERHQATKGSGNKIHFMI